ncbi:inner membrane CreD family protein, partial [Patescibacteria group bacterium]|nr:inner membrane CreD family protein [Patescibacteria group bacterium]
LIYEREMRSNQVVNEVSSKWGFAQTITGPMLTIPYTSYYRDSDDKLRSVVKYAHFLPDGLKINGEVNPEIRYRGLYKVVLYNATLEISGYFPKPSFEEWGIPEEHIKWAEARISIGIPDMRGIQEAIELDWNGDKFVFNPGIENNADLKSGVSTNVDLNKGDSTITRYDFSLHLDINGSRNLNFVPLGKETNVSLINPSFKLLLKADKKKKNHYELLRGKDESKDQSYFIYRIKQSELEHTLFPIGDYTKKKIREIAEKNNFPNYNKKSTVGICFIGKVDLKKFLQKEIKAKKGKIFDPKGNIIGEHDGIYYYTIGQRLGPRYGFEINRQKSKEGNIQRWYVARKNIKKNTIIAAPEGHSLNFRKEIFIKNVFWINKEPKTKRVYSRIRQVGELLPSKLTKEKNRFKITLKKAITGVSEGQAIVLYKGKKVLGGGEIIFK